MNLLIALFVNYLFGVAVCAAIDKDDRLLAWVNTAPGFFVVLAPVIVPSFWPVILFFHLRNPKW